MKRKKQILVGVLVGFVMLGQERLNAHAVKYEEKWSSAFEKTTGVYQDLIETSDGETVGIINTVDLNDGAFENSIIIKYGKQGNILCENEFSGDGQVFLNSLTETIDGGYVAVGFINDDATENAIAIKINSDGTQEWVNEIEGKDAMFYSVTTTKKYDVIATGVMEDDGVVVRFDSEGKEELVYSLSDNQYGILTGIIQHSDGTYTICGYTGSMGLAFDSSDTVKGVLIKLDSDWNQGILIHKENYVFQHIYEKINDGVIVSGMTVNGFQPFMINYDKNFRKEWVLSLDNMKQLGRGIMMNNGNSLVPGVSKDYNGVLLSIDQQGGVTTIHSKPMTMFSSLTPNTDGGFITGTTTLSGYKTTIVKYSPKKDSDIQINGRVETMVADITIPSVSPDLVINPNLPEGSVSPEFSVSNDSISPIKLELKTFEQTTDTFNDVLPTKYDSWIGLNKQQSQDIALGLVAKEGDGWQTLTTPTSYVAGHSNHEIGIIKPTSTVDFSFDVKHGTAFSEAKAVQYKMIFVFDLMS